MLGPVPDLPAPEALVGRVAVLLLRHGADGLGDALAALVEGTGARSAVLRRTDPDGQLLATAGEVVQAVSPRRRAGVAGVAGVQLTVCGADGAPLAELAVHGALPHCVPLLRDVACLLGLVLGAQSYPSVAPSALADVEAERTTLADALHDGPLQDLVAARYAADVAVRQGADPAVRAQVQAALVGLRRHVWQLRPRGEDGLADALARLSAQLVDRGAAPLVLRLDPSADVLSRAAALAVYRLVQTTATDPASGQVTVRLARQSAPGGREVVALSVDGGAPVRDPARWRRTAAALGGDLLCCPGRLRLSLPTRTSQCPAPPGSLHIARLPVPALHPSPEAAP